MKINIPLLILTGGLIYFLTAKAKGNVVVATQATKNVEFAGFSGGFSGGKFIGMIKLAVTNTSANQLMIKNLKVWIQALGSTVATSIPTADQLAQMVIRPQSRTVLNVPVSIDLLAGIVAASQLSTIKSLNANAVIDIDGFPEITLSNYAIPFDGASIVTKISQTADNVQNTVQQVSNDVSSFRQNIVAKTVADYKAAHPDETVNVYSDPSFFGDAFATYYLQATEDNGGPVVTFTYKITVTGDLDPNVNINVDTLTLESF